MTPQENIDPKEGGSQVEDMKALARRWAQEFDAAKKEVEKWHKQGEKVLARFRDERKDSTEDNLTRWNVYSSNVQTQQAILYGQTPKVDVSRRFRDSKDDTARVACVLLERLLNSDIESEADSFALALQYSLMDRLIPGFGMAKVRYSAEYEDVPGQPAITHPETGEELAPAVEATQRKTGEDCCVDYVHWRDQLWSPSRTFHEVRWWAFAAEMSRSEVVERFGTIGKLVPLNAKRKDGSPDTSDAAKDSPWARAQVWEVWDKESRKVFWVVDGFERCLDVQDDPLGLPGFWPFPRPMVANLTTSNMVPVPDFILAQDLYNEIDNVSGRITLLEQAVAVRGGYDEKAEGLKRLLKESKVGRNELIPIGNWSQFMEKGGIVGAIAWMPLEMIVQALSVLREVRQELIQAVNQVTGMSDIMRGQAGDGDVTATEQSIKAKFGSVRMTAVQNEFARFASDLQRIKAQVISLHFDPETIYERSNAAELPDEDQPLVQPAIALLKSKQGLWRTEVKPDNVALADMGAKRSEATEFVQALSAFLTSAGPLAQAIPGSAGALLELLGVVMSRFKFADEVEGIIDGAVAQVKAQAQQPQPPPTDPKVLMQAQKNAADLQKVQVEHQNDMQKIAAETQAQAIQQAQQTQANVQEELARERIKAAYRPPPRAPGAPQ